MESNVLKAKREVTLAAEQMITQICALEREVITSIIIKSVSPNKIYFLYSNN